MDGATFVDVVQIHLILRDLGILDDVDQIWLSRFFIVLDPRNGEWRFEPLRSSETYDSAILKFT